eukprot:TRINITY_DN12460_c0_g1_i1.p1 TRINITY_DN12460_c0_g1~~TRINITY_DN12460_c0_g1_i1.p1  ORF type:complete len:231 (-),score=42.78 TRINITY_DN12460_c0_g1_i1:101-718(-)
MPVGRLASQAATLLMGKHKPIYHPTAVECGDRVIVVNASKAILTGDKLQQKLYRHHTGWPGGLKEISAGYMLQRFPDRIISRAISGMLPKNKLRRERLGNLRVTGGVEGAELYAQWEQRQFGAISPETRRLIGGDANAGSSLSPAARELLERYKDLKVGQFVVHESLHRNILPEDFQAKLLADYDAAIAAQNAPKKTGCSQERCC